MSTPNPYIMPEGNTMAIFQLPLLTQLLDYHLYALLQTYPRDKLGPLIFQINTVKTTVNQFIMGLFDHHPQMNYYMKANDREYVNMAKPEHSAVHAGGPPVHRDVDDHFGHHYEDHEVVGGPAVEI